MYAAIVCYIISDFKRRTRMDSRDRIRERRYNQGNVRIILLVADEGSRIRNDVPSECSRRCRTARVIAGGLESIAELEYVILI